jgi:hypothetical protein
MTTENTHGPDPDEVDDAESADAESTDGESGDDEFVICSDEAYVVSATITCGHCRRPFEAISTAWTPRSRSSCAPGPSSVRPSGIDSAVHRIYTLYIYHRGADDHEYQPDPQQA